MVVDLTELEDFAAAAAANIARFEVKFVLSPTLMAKDPFCIESLDWDYIPYGDDQIEKFLKTTGVYMRSAYAKKAMCYRSIATSCTSESQGVNQTDHYESVTEIT